MKKIILAMAVFGLAASTAFAAMELNAPTGPMAEDAPGLRVGDMAPDFEAMTAEGGTVKLADLYAKGPVVLIFYRGAWCPFCNLHLRSFGEWLEEFSEKNATVLAVSVDKAEYALKTEQDNHLGFRIVTNPDASILEAYKGVFAVPADLAVKYRDEYGIDLEKHSGRTDHVIAVPATYVIGTDGRITFAYADLDYKTRATPQQVLEAIE